MHAPTTIHLEAVYHILRYFKRSYGVGLLYSRQFGLRIEAYMDVDWAISVYDKWSTSSYFTFVGGNLFFLIDRVIH